MHEISTVARPHNRTARLVVSAIVLLVVAALGFSWGERFWLKQTEGPEEIYYQSGLKKLGTHGRGNLQPALADFNQAIQLNPKSVKAYRQRGIVLRLMKQPEAALADLTQAIQLDPHTAENYFERAMTFAAMNRAEEALQDLDEAIRLNPRYYEAYALRGARAYSVQQWDKAISDLSRAIQVMPRDATPAQQYELYAKRGGAFLRSGKPDEALADFDKTVTLYPEQGQPYRNRGMAYLMKNQFRPAAADFLKSHELDPAFDLTGILAIFQAHLRVETDAATKAAIEKLLTRTQK